MVNLFFAQSFIIEISAAALKIILLFRKKREKERDFIPHTCVSPPQVKEENSPKKHTLKL
jgi:hypothetical protein